MPEEVKQTVFTDMLVSAPVLLDSEEKDGKTRVRFKATQSNVVNDNLRMYPDAVMDAAIADSNKSIVEGRMVGESPHPGHYAGKTGLVFDTKIENSVIKIYNQFKEDGTVYVDAEVLDTAKGKDLQALIKAGVPVGISMRALGDGVRKQIGGVMVDVATRLEIKSYDVVMNPATAGCEVVQVLTDSQVEEIMQDGVQITPADCPQCGQPLTPQDPDGDNDLDFYSCEHCKEVFIPTESKTVSIRASQVLQTLPNDPDYDGYGLAMQYKANHWGKTQPTGMTDATGHEKEGDETMPNIEEMLKAMADSPEFQAMIDARAEAKAKPALDALEAAKTEKEAQAAKDALVAEKAAFVDEKAQSLKGKITDESIKVIVDAANKAKDKETASVIIDSLVANYSTEASKAMLDSVGFTGAAQPQGAVRVEVGHEHKPWAKHMKAMSDAMDREMLLRDGGIDQSIRKVNQPVVDKLIEHAEKKAVLYDGSGNPLKFGYEAMKDSAEYLDSQVFADNVSVTTGNVLNQPTISALLLQQTFQDVESLQFLHTEAFEGSEVRFMSEYYNSVAAINPDTGTFDILVPEGQGVVESGLTTTWITFNPDWRRNAISMTTDVINTMLSGPAKYDVLSRGIYHISQEKRRIMDNIAYAEMMASSDEYKPTVVTAETATAVGSSAGQITASTSGNVVYTYNLTVNGTANTTAGSNPVVRPRKKRQAGANGQVTEVWANQFTVTVGGSTKTRGYLDANGNVQGGNYAVNYENGVVYFAASAGVSGSALPTFAYSAMTNYDRWSLTKGSGYTKDEDWTNTLLTQLTTTAANMSSAPRFKRPNLAIMSMNTAARIQNASMWYKLNNPDVGSLSGLAASTNFGSRSNVNFAQINATGWNDGRILLTQKGATKYAVETPYQIEGPFASYDSNGNLVAAKKFMGQENSVFCTPLNVDNNGQVINPVSRTLKIVQ